MLRALQLRGAQPWRASACSHEPLLGWRQTGLWNICTHVDNSGLDPGLEASGTAFSLWFWTEVWIPRRIAWLGKGRWGLFPQGQPRWKPCRVALSSVGRTETTSRYHATLCQLLVRRFTWSVHAQQRGIIATQYEDRNSERLRNILTDVKDQPWVWKATLPYSSSHTFFTASRQCGENGVLGKKYGARPWSKSSDTQSSVPYKLVPLAEKRTFFWIAPISVSMSFSFTKNKQHINIDH